MHSQTNTSWLWQRFRGTSQCMAFRAIFPHRTTGLSALHLQKKTLFRWTCVSPIGKSELILSKPSALPLQKPDADKCHRGYINFCGNHPTAHPLFYINLVILRDCVIVHEANMGRLQFAIWGRAESDRSGESVSMWFDTRFDVLNTLWPKCLGHTFFPDIALFNFCVFRQNKTTGRS